MAARFLEDEDVAVRREAIDTLRDHGDIRSAALAARVLDDDDDLTVTSALECLARWKARRWADRVARLLTAPSELTRSYAAWALGKLGSQRHVVLLRSRFRSVSTEIEGSAVAEALYMLTRKPRYLRYLLEQLRSSDPEIRAFTGNSLVGVLDRNNFPTIMCAIAHAVSAERNAAIAPHLQRDLEIAVDNAIEAVREHGG